MAGPDSFDWVQQMKKGSEDVGVAAQKASEAIDALAKSEHLPPGDVRSLKSATASAIDTLNFKYDLSDLSNPNLVAILHSATSRAFEEKYKEIGLAEEYPWLPKKFAEIYETKLKK